MLFWATLVRIEKFDELIDNTGGVRKFTWPLGVKNKNDAKGTVYYYKDRSLPIFLIIFFKPGAKHTLALLKYSEMHNKCILIQRLCRWTFVSLSSYNRRECG